MDSIQKLQLCRIGTNVPDFITRQTYGNYVHLARHGLCRIYALLSRIRFCREYALFLGLFCPDFYSDIRDFTQILCRYLAKKLAAGTSAQECVFFSTLRPGGAQHPYAFSEFCPLTGPYDRFIAPPSPPSPSVKCKDIHASLLSQHSCEMSSL